MSHIDAEIKSVISEFRKDRIGMISRDPYEIEKAEEQGGQSNVPFEEDKLRLT